MDFRNAAGYMPPPKNEFLVGPDWKRVDDSDSVVEEGSGTTNIATKLCREYVANF
jgi:hypothetical protein